MDSGLVMFFDRGYGLAWFHKSDYTEVSHDILRKSIRIEQRNFEWSDELHEKYKGTKINIIKLN